jgi:excinuclease ABC subunit A
VLKIEMHFLPDVYVTCDVCHGKRYNRETLEVKFKGHQHRRRARHDGRGRGRVLQGRPPDPRQDGDAGRGRPRLCQGRPAGDDPLGRRGAARQARQGAVRRATGKTLYILDEPTTGLHFEDVRKLLEVLHALVEQGNTVVVIEHNLDVIKTADWVIDLGPEGGVKGGEIVAEGTPETVVKEPRKFRNTSRLGGQSN